MALVLHTSRAMGSILLSWLALAAVIWLTAKLVPGVSVRSAGASMVVAAVFGLLHLLLGWLLYVAIGFGTLGLGFLLAFLTRWIVTALLLQLTGRLSKNFDVDGFKSAFFAAAVMSGLSLLVDWLLPHSDLF